MGDKKCRSCTFVRGQLGRSFAAHSSLNHALGQIRASKNSTGLLLQTNTIYIIYEWYLLNQSIPYFSVPFIAFLSCSLLQSLRRANTWSWPSYIYRVSYSSARLQPHGRSCYILGSHAARLSSWPSHPVSGSRSSDLTNCPGRPAPSSKVS
jgi:hypothetical protein